MKTFFFQALGLLLLIFAGTYITFNRSAVTPFTRMFAQPSAPGQAETEQRNVLRIVGADGVTKVELVIEIADEKEERSKGLGFRESLATDSGMLFIHEDLQKYTYWMKGMQFPIDIMWIKGDTIADIIPNIPPPIAGQTDETLERYASTVEVDRVLETNAGFVSQYGIQRGDKIVIAQE